MIRMPKGFELRRRKELREELVNRARVWLPDWRPRDGTDDFAAALFEIVARLESEVTQRLGKIPEKTFRGFLYWLGVRPDAGRAARLPVVFRMTAGAEPVLARSPIQLQATPAQTETSAAAEPVTFETEDDLMVSAGSLAAVVGVDPANDKFFLPPSRYSSLEAPKPTPTEWRAKSEARAPATQIQLDPELGLDSLPTLLHVEQKKQYRVTKADGPLVTIDPPLETAVAEGDHFAGSTAFDPFGDFERNRQEHALYIGSESVLNLPTTATITIPALTIAARGATWSYWGKSGPAEAVDWQDLKPLDPKPGTSLTLSKEAGSVEMREIGGKTSRWLRALQASSATLETSPVSSLQLTVNCNKSDTATCPPDADKRSTVVVEAIANTTPLVLNQGFFPLGPEPKLFDAFYLGCPEAFSKTDASVRICFEALDATASALTAAQVGGAVNEVMLFGIGHDGTLLRLKPTDDLANPLTKHPALRPPFDASGTASVNAAPTPLNNDQPRVTAVTRAVEGDVIVAVTAGEDAWVWLQKPSVDQGRWILLKAVKSPDVTTDPSTPATVIALQDGAGIRVVGLNDKKLFELKLGSGWDSRPIPNWQKVDVAGWEAAKWVAISPVFRSDLKMTGGVLDSGWLAVTEQGDDVVLFGKGAGNDSKPKRRLNVGTVLPDTPPLAVHYDAAAPANADTLFVVARKATDTVRAWRMPYAGQPGPTKKTTAILLGHSFDWADSATDGFTVVFTRDAKNGQGEVVAWFPFTGGAAEPTTAYPSPPIAGLSGAPGVVTSLLTKRIAAPGDGAHLHGLSFDPDALREATFNANKVASALVVQSATAPVVDFVQVTPRGAADATVLPITDPFIKESDSRYWLELPSSEGGTILNSPTLYTKRIAATFDGDIFDADNDQSIITAAVGDRNASKNDVVIVENLADNVLSVHSISEDPVQGPGAWKITVKPAVKNAPVGQNVRYTYVTAAALDFEILPAVTTDALSASEINAISLNGAYFDGAEPFPNQVLFVQASPPAPLPVAVLKRAWAEPPTVTAGNVTLVTSAIFANLVTIADTKITNPTLSWEYWDGQAWWRIEGLTDGTSHLRETGVVEFCVPAGLKPTDVVGRTSHWIRARLVAGDYGQETVTTRSHPETGHPEVTITTVDRSTSKITPPHLASIDLRYSVCCPAYPDYVLTRDGGRTRDQTDANTIEGAQIEIFMPLAESIRRAASIGANVPGDSGRAVFLGFDNRIEGGPISVLFQVEEGTHDAAYPLQVDVLRERGFERVVADDGTRGLNETGVLTFFLSAAPPPIALFGSETRYWLRLRPNERFTATEWLPKIRAAFLNGTFAIAAETQDLERLGSSDGSPGQQVFLSRPPVIKDTLELRVNEPIGDEELAALRAVDPEVVRDTISDPRPGDRLSDLPGKWVRWKEVLDPADGASDERIYSLDAETGRITFGNGEHGKIPPIGRDSIVAVSYKRGGGDPANKVASWSQINLITPIPGVEAVVAPEGAAGGSDAQTPENVLRFASANQFMRDRALTLRDFEMLAMQFSPDVAQAHALPSAAGVRLVVVMRGRDPIPSQAIRREMIRFLADKALPALTTHGAIDIVPPAPVDVRFDLQLTIDRIEHSGAVAQDAQSRIAALLDPVSGGVDKTGWRVGDVPTDTDVAAVLDGIAHLEEIDSVKILDAKTNAQLSSLAPTQLARLAPEGVVFRLEPAEVLA